MSDETKRKDPKADLKGNPVAKEKAKGEAPKKEQKSSLVGTLRAFRAGRSVGRK